ncbi:MAG: FAD:protein transferase [Chthoniobacter sp.]|jgi:thiamine biosynthesis lipoprotein|nr:FAD:protein transferase [Chthoniobacter sp.]
MIVRARPLLGTFVEIQADGLSELDGHRSIDRAFDAMAEVQRRMSFHDPASTLSRLNRLASHGPVRVDEWTFDVLKTAAEIHLVSHGVFDVTIAPHLQRLGFLPPAAGPAVPMAARRWSFADVQLLPDRSVRFLHPNLRIDLGGIAKGFAVDQAVAALQAAGVERGVVNAGGDLRVFGQEAFVVSIRHPARPGTALGTLSLSNRALATSAHYFADERISGRRLGPFINPRTGRRQARLQSVSVDAPTAILADALTKVVMLAPDDSAHVLERFGASALCVAAGRGVRCIPGGRAAFQLAAQPFFPSRRHRPAHSFNR